MEKAGLHEDVAAQHDIFHGGHVGEQLDVLKGAGDTQPGDLIRAQALDVLPAEPDDAVIWAVDAVDAVEKRGLAGAVGADNGENLFFLHLERNTLQGVQPSEGNGEVFDAEEGHGILG